MSVTRGGENRRKYFHWRFDDNSDRVAIENENGIEHSFSSLEIQNILNKLYSEFEYNFFPLANNVELLGNHAERRGLGMIILEQPSANVYHAQGSSYLGVILEDCGYLEWNGQHRGIAWKLIDHDFSLTTIKSRLSRPSTRK